RGFHKVSEPRIGNSMRVDRERLDSDHSRRALAVLRQRTGIVTNSHAAAADAHDAIRRRRAAILGRAMCCRTWLTALQACAAAGARDGRNFGVLVAQGVAL